MTGSRPAVCSICSAKRPGVATRMSRKGEVPSPPEVMMMVAVVVMMEEEKEGEVVVVVVTMTKMVPYLASEPPSLPRTTPFRRTV